MAITPMKLNNNKSIAHMKCTIKIHKITRMFHNRQIVIIYLSYNLSRRARKRNWKKK